jgi:Holliday junction resolvasome RuvABC DNA-binding subunit
LREAGIESIQDLASKSVEDLAEIPRLGKKTAQQLIDQAKEWVPSSSESESLPEVETVQEEDQTEEAASGEEVLGPEADSEPEVASEPEADSEEEPEKTT